MKLFVANFNQTGKDPWVLVCGGFHRAGGMDKANLALAEFLLREGHPVHLVCYSAVPELFKEPKAKVYLVKRPLGAFALGNLFLNQRGKRIAKLVTSENPATRVVVNGGNCFWNDINWVHYVHTSSPISDDKTPLWFRAKNRLFNRTAAASERRIIGRAKLVLTNSEVTRRDLIEKVGIDANKIHTVYLGTDSTWAPPSNSESRSARHHLGLAAESPVVTFVGALGLDNRKGFDTLLAAWQILCSEPSWDAQLVVAGGGKGLNQWKRRVHLAGLSHRIKFLGFTPDIPSLLAAADILVSPARYEPFGLNVQEAVCRGVPSMVSASAGIAELFPPELKPMLLPDCEDFQEIAERLKLWRTNIDFWKLRFSFFGAALRANSWRDMAVRFVSIASDCPRLAKCELTSSGLE